MLIHIRKERFKFSSSHMTVFPDGSKEALHGHNYQVELTVELPELPFEAMVSFADLKKPLRALCEKWDEKVLVATKNPYFKLKSKSSKAFAFELCKKEYSLPSDEVVCLDSDNITTENLCLIFAKQFEKALSAPVKKHILSFTIRIDETPGQGASIQVPVSKKSRRR